MSFLSNDTAPEAVSWAAAGMSSPNPWQQPRSHLHDVGGELRISHTPTARDSRPPSTHSNGTTTNNKPREDGFALPPLPVFPTRLFDSPSSQAERDNTAATARSRHRHEEEQEAPQADMELLHDGAQAVRASAQSVRNGLGGVYRAVTSRTAQRTLVTMALFGTAGLVLLGVACTAYWAFYWSYLPDQVVTLPVHLQYGYEVNPYGVVSLKDQSFAAYQDYDISVTLELPRSPTNLGHGNFMLALHLLDDTKSPEPPTDDYEKQPPLTAAVPKPSLLRTRTVLHTATRPAIMPYRDPLVSLASRVLFLAYHIVRPASETERLTVPMVERLEFQPGRMAPTRLVLDVQAGQTLQVYRAAVTITAQLSGLRWFMHSWTITAFVLFTAAFWAVEVVALGMGYLVLRVVFGTSEKKMVAGTKNIKKEELAGKREPMIKREEALEDVPMTFPTSTHQRPLRYEPESPTNGVGRVLQQVDVPPPQTVGGEADDEYEDAGALDAGEEEEEDLAARDSGIGTSYSEGGAAGLLRRRTSRGRVGSGGGQ